MIFLYSVWFESRTHPHSFNNHPLINSKLWHLIGIPNRKQISNESGFSDWLLVLVSISALFWQTQMKLNNLWLGHEFNISSGLRQLKLEYKWESIQWDVEQSCCSIATGPVFLAKSWPRSPGRCPYTESWITYPGRWRRIWVAGPFSWIGCWFS